MAQASHVHYATPPNMLGLFSKALLPKSTPVHVNIPALTAGIEGVKTDLPKMQAFAWLSNHLDNGYMPGTWPHILAFPLHLSLLTHKQFPLPLLGLVHLRNEISQFRPISAYEVVDIQCSLDNTQETLRGTEFDILTTVHSAGSIVWESRSTLLHRTQSKAPQKNQPRSPINTFSNNEVWSLAENLGRRYAQLSGDMNPIHLHKLSANLFGFKKAIVHGMWSKSRALATLLNHHPMQAYKIDVQFKLPVFLPADINFQWQDSNNHTEFQLLDNSCSKPHLTGNLASL